MKLIHLLPIFLFLSTFGCTLGMKSMSDCEESTSISSKMECYHLAAVSLAYKGAGSQAEQACRDIVNLARDTGHITGYPPDLESDDLGKKAMTEKNICLYDVAKAYARRAENPSEALSMCNEIEEADLGWAVAGAPVTKDMCIQQVSSLSRLNYDEYHEHGLCSLVFIFPLLLFASLKR